MLNLKNGGGGIRTHGALADTLVFKTRALNHSTTPPGDKYSNLTFKLYQKMIKSISSFASTSKCN